MIKDKKTEIKIKTIKHQNGGKMKRVFNFSLIIIGLAILVIISLRVETGNRLYLASGKANIVRFVDCDLLITPSQSKNAILVEQVALFDSRYFNCFWFIPITKPMVATSPDGLLRFTSQKDEDAKKAAEEIWKSFVVKTDNNDPSFITWR